MLVVVVVVIVVEALLRWRQDELGARTTDRLRQGDDRAGKDAQKD